MKNDISKIKLGCKFKVCDALTAEALDFDCNKEYECVGLTIGHDDINLKFGTMNVLVAYNDKGKIQHIYEQFVEVLGSRQYGDIRIGDTIRLIGVPDGFDLEDMRIMDIGICSGLTMDFISKKEKVCFSKKDKNGTDLSWYFETKYLELVEPRDKITGKCICPINSLMIQGCRCGGK